MRLKTKVQLAPLKFTTPEGDFTLFTRLPSPTERMSLFDSMSSGSMETLQRSVQLLIGGWAGVETEDGTPKLFEAKDPKTGDLTGENNLDELLQSVSVGTQCKVIAAVLAFNGMHVFADKIMAGVSRVLGEGADLRPTETPANDSSAAS